MDSAAYGLADLPAADVSARTTETQRERFSPALTMSFPQVAIGAEAVPLTPGQLMQANLASVFCEEDEAARSAAFGLLWHDDPVIYDRETAAAGRPAVLGAAGRFAKRLGSGSCTPTGSVVGHNGLYMMRWALMDGLALVGTGCHVAQIRKSRIDTLYVVED
ncbi:hypothetical protein [Sphingomonas sp. BK235]|uniref:hypothetical protein n=1 Tax=Sphingomonas sp. BK235 TaxID=2512131 RepID=UPI0010527BB8|nr:hypothetical protein [Sphingomonas sp. BK235]TCP36080.1 hypothetical protein EV292_102671 [Sphingomonas sp. BK235]